MSDDEWTAVTAVASKISERHKDEWREVTRKLRPDWTDEQFEQEWAEFQRQKQEGRFERPLQ